MHHLKGINATILYIEKGIYDVIVNEIDKLQKTQDTLIASNLITSSHSALLPLLINHLTTMTFSSNFYNHGEVWLSHTRYYSVIISVYYEYMLSKIPRVVVIKHYCNDDSFEATEISCSLLL